MDTVSSTTSFSSTPTSGPIFPVVHAACAGPTVQPVPSSSPVTLSDPDAVPPTLTIVSASKPAFDKQHRSSFHRISLRAYTPLPRLIPTVCPALVFSCPGHSLPRIPQSQGQLFLWLPTIIQSALGLPSEQVKTFALQVFLPATQVPVLANQIKVISSPPLASHVNPAYSLTSVQDPNAVPGTGTTSSVNSSGNKSRTDAIIGVASALGGLALVVLGVLIYRSVKRSRDLSHRRLSDPNAPNAPYPDRTGRDFDQDSVGGQRRRSFYFGRGYYRTSPDGVRERRAPVVTGAISAPILTQSSLNW
ncbi:hypothetical protein EDB84DRAFT_1585923 [Lactarius hengduanensis]|nr:hypothetical protein EDB84DRAFT_1585923 [Lactarius hengduanensis]